MGLVNLHKLDLILDLWVAIFNNTRYNVTCNIHLLLISRKELFNYDNKKHRNKKGKHSYH